MLVEQSSTTCAVPPSLLTQCVAGAQKLLQFALAKSSSRAYIRSAWPAKRVGKTRIVCTLEYRAAMPASLPPPVSFLFYRTGACGHLHLSAQEDGKKLDGQGHIELLRGLVPEVLRRNLWMPGRSGTSQQLRATSTSTYGPMHSNPFNFCRSTERLPRPVYTDPTTDVVC
jgi:hypothetical protein